MRAAAASYTWERTVEQLIAVYREAAVAPARASAEPRESLTDLAMSLVGPKGWLTPDDQLALLAVAARPALKRTVFGALRGGYRAMYRVRRARGGGGSGANVNGGWCRRVRTGRGVLGASQTDTPRRCHEMSPPSARRTAPTPPPPDVRPASRDAARTPRTRAAHPAPATRPGGCAGPGHPQDGRERLVAVSVEKRRSETVTPARTRPQERGRRGGHDERRRVALGCVAAKRLAGAARRARRDTGRGRTAAAAPPRARRRRLAAG